MSFGAVSPIDIERVWPVCEPMLQRAIDKGESCYTMEEYKQGCKKNVFQLWAWVEDDVIACCAITHIVEYPSMKLCSLMLVGGGKLKSWLKPAFEIMAEWAKSRGCTEMEGYARKGWLRVLPEWRQCWITVRRSL